MQVFRNLQQPESYDVKTLPGYENLTEAQRIAAHTMYQNCYEAYAGRGIRIAQGMAFETVKRHLGAIISECAVDHVVSANKEGAPHVEKAAIPQAHPVSSAFPEVASHVDPHHLDMLRTINQLFQEPERPEVAWESDHLDESDNLVQNVADHISTFLNEKRERTYDDVLTHFGYKAQPSTVQGAAPVYVQGNSKITLDAAGGFQHITNGTSAQKGIDPQDLHNRLAALHRSKGKGGCGSNVCMGPDKGKDRIRNHNN